MVPTDRAPRSSNPVQPNVSADGASDNARQVPRKRRSMAGASAMKKRSRLEAAEIEEEEKHELSNDRDSEVEMQMVYDDDISDSRIKPGKSSLGQRADISDDASNKLIARFALQGHSPMHNNFLQENAVVKATDDDRENKTLNRLPTKRGCPAGENSEVLLAGRVRQNSRSYL